MRIGIIGLPNSGKTTVFNALTRGQAATTDYTGHLQVHSATVLVPDDRLDRLIPLFNPKKIVHAAVQYKDIAGLSRGIGESGGLTGRLLNEIQQNDALLLVVRAFANPNVAHPEGSIDPLRDINLVETELILSDMQIIESRLERLQVRIGKGGNPQEIAAAKQEQALLQRLLGHLEEEVPLRQVHLSADEEKALRGFAFLSQKPMLIVINISGEDGMEGDIPLPSPGAHTMVTSLRGRLESELVQMEPEEAEEFLSEFGIAELGLSRLIRMSYELLHVQTFFTASEEEVHAWTIPVATTAWLAADTIHSDIARGFIRAEIISVDDLVAAGSLAEARRQAKLRLEGKDYILQDGEVMHVRFAL